MDQSHISKVNALGPLSYPSYHLHSIEMETKHRYAGFPKSHIRVGHPGIQRYIERPCLERKKERKKLPVRCFENINKLIFNLIK